MTAEPLRILLFAQVSDAAGVSEVHLEGPAPPTVAGVLDRLTERYPELESWLPSTAVAVNEAYVDRSHPVNPGDVIALIPPVSGG